MPCYYFHVLDRGELIEDPDGLELCDLAAAREECSRIVQGILGEEGWRGGLVADRRFQIVDELGRTVLIVPFTALATI